MKLFQVTFVKYNLLATLLAIYNWSPFDSIKIKGILKREKKKYKINSSYKESKLLHKIYQEKKKNL